MNYELFISILAMDSYNRGYNQGVFGLSDSGQIGQATLITAPLPVGYISSGFYASAYDWNGLKVISYRGTDNYNIVDKTSDLYDGWTVGLGFNTATQAQMAIDYYQSITQMPIYNSAASACEAIPTNSAPIRYKSRRPDQASLKMRIPVFSE